MLSILNSPLPAEEAQRKQQDPKGPMEVWLQPVTDTTVDRGLASRVLQPRLAAALPSAQPDLASAMCLVQFSLLLSFSYAHPACAHGVGAPWCCLAGSQLSLSGLSLLAAAGKPTVQVPAGRQGLLRAEELRHSHADPGRAGAPSREAVPCVSWYRWTEGWAPAGPQLSHLGSCFRPGGFSLQRWLKSWRS